MDPQSQENESQRRTEENQGGGDMRKRSFGSLVTQALTQSRSRPSWSCATQLHFTLLVLEREAQLARL